MKSKVNKRVIINSILALICLALTYFVHWLFILPIAYFLWDNQKQLMKKD